MDKLYNYKCRWGKRGKEVTHGVLERRKVWGSNGRLGKESRISRRVKRALHERVVTSTIMLWS